MRKRDQIRRVAGFPEGSPVSGGLKLKDWLTWQVTEPVATIFFAAAGPAVAIKPIRGTATATATATSLLDRIASSLPLRRCRRGFRRPPQAVSTAGLSRMRTHATIAVAFEG